MKHLRLTFLIVIMLVATALISRPAMAQATLVVDEDGQATAADCEASSNAFSTIQSAVDVAAPGDTIFICPGTYDEQIEITTNNLTLSGSGMDATVIQPSAVVVNSSGTNTPFPVAAILLVSGAEDVSLHDLTIDGRLADGGAANLSCLQVGFFGGIYFRNSSGTVQAAHLSHINSNTVCSFGLAISSDSNHVSHLTVNASHFDNYGGEGLRCGGVYVTCTITNNVLQGRGPVDDQIQGGIILRGGAGAEISGNILRDHTYIPAVGIYEFAVGIALFNAEPDTQPHLLQENTFSGNQLDVQRQGSAQPLE